MHHNVSAKYQGDIGIEEADIFEKMGRWRMSKNTFYLYMEFIQHQVPPSLKSPGYKIDVRPERECVSVSP